MMGYSKGPLRIAGPSQGKGPGDDGGNFAIVEPGGLIMGEAFCCVGEDALRDAEANAQLWARAPDMQVALEIALPLLIEYRKWLVDDAIARGDVLEGKAWGELDAQIGQVRAAIAN